MVDDETVKRTASGNVRKYTDNALPMARVRKIMKMDPNITDNITTETNYLICAATEIFVKQLSKGAYELDKRCLSYQSIAKYVQKDEKLDFLHEFLPHKITVRDYKKILSEEKEKRVDGSSDSEDSSSESVSDEEESEDSENENEEQRK